MEPKIIDHPGAGKIQEMTLDQYLGLLSADHLARKQLDEIRAQALKAVEISTQLMKANEKIMELQNMLIAGSQPKTVPTGTNYEVTASASTPEPKPLLEKVPCPICQKPVSPSPGAWASHQRNQHPDNPAPRPNV